MDIVVSLTVHYDDRSNSYSLYKPRPPPLKDTNGLCPGRGPGPGGYNEFQFIDSQPSSTLLSAIEDMTICKICYLLSRDPCLSCCCGHTFCKSCIDALGDDAMCPLCRDEKFQAVKNKQVERAIKSLHVSCTNSEAGCTWQGELSYIKAHLKHCQYEKVACDKCGITMEQGLLHDHQKLNTISMSRSKIGTLCNVASKKVLQ